jgi:hypothetical protein
MVLDLLLHLSTQFNHINTESLAIGTGDVTNHVLVLTALR